MSALPAQDFTLCVDCACVSVIVMASGAHRKLVHSREKDSATPNPSLQRKYMDPANTNPGIPGSTGAIVGGVSASTTPPLPPLPPPSVAALSPHKTATTPKTFYGRKGGVKVGGRGRRSQCVSRQAYRHHHHLSSPTKLCEVDNTERKLEHVHMYIMYKSVAISVNSV